MREHLDSYGRICVGALVGAAVTALLYGGLAFDDGSPVDLARHPEAEPLQPGTPSQPQMTSVDAASVTSVPPTSTTTTTVTSTTTTTTTAHPTTTTTTHRHATTTTVAQPPPVTTTQAPPPPPTTTKCHWLIC